MNRSPSLLVLVALLLLGGFLTVQILLNGPGGALPGLIVQTLDESSSTLAVGPGQAVAFIVFIMFTLGALIASGGILALLFRHLDREAAEAKKDEE